MEKPSETSLTANRKLLHLVLAAVAGTLAPGCADKNSTDKGTGLPAYCAPSDLPGGAPITGSARVFSPDPLIASGDRTLSPASSNLDRFVTQVTLRNLGDQGVLNGKYVDVRDGGACGPGYGTYDRNGEFSYLHSDPRFQEAMTYYWGDQYRQSLDAARYLQPATAVQIFAHCPKAENAFFVKGQDQGGKVVEQVCLGYSESTPGAYYADDATVTLHELQHATTTDTYAPAPDGYLNQFSYDEAGALNEAVSDFMALMYEQPLLPSAWDPKLFSRWALGTFIPNHPGTRGANRCPAYDPTYPNCTGFPAFSAASNTISYVYPDGMGWPYANDFRGPGYASNAFSTYNAQEEIHNAGVLLEGALWDVYDAIKTNHSGDEGQAQLLATQLVLESIKHLPQPSLVPAMPAVSPVTFRGLASKMVQYAGPLGFNSADQASVSSVLTERGLLGGALLSPSWLAVGPGNAGVTPGIRVQDNPDQLKSWLLEMSQDPKTADWVPQGFDTGLNGKLDSGELAALWFDLGQNEATTAAGVQVTVTALDPEVTFDRPINTGWLTNSKAQIVYGKVNGSAIVSALTASNATYNIGTGTSYFRTNPFFDRSWTTALWVRVASGAAHGATVRFLVEALPANGAASTATFTATIH